MLNEAQSKVRDSEGKWMGNQCALLIVSRPGPRMHDLAYERDFVIIILLVRKLSFRGVK